MKLQKDKLTEKFIEKLQKNESIDIRDLYEFSKISLKRNRIRKKFNKHYERYVSKEINQFYFSMLCTTKLVDSLKIYYEFSKDFVKVEPISDSPNVKLYY